MVSYITEGYSVHYLQPEKNHPLASSFLDSPEEYRRQTRKCM